MKKKKRSPWLRRCARRLLPVSGLIMVFGCVALTFLVIHTSGSDRQRFRAIADRHILMSANGALRHFDFVDNNDPDLSEISHLDPDDDPFLYLCAHQKHLIQNQKRPEDKVYNFNVTASDFLPCGRDIPDTRPKICMNKPKYSNLNLTTSIVIPFYNEALSALFRTVHSIILRTPPALLKEIILVDDASTYDYLKGESFVNYWQRIPKVRLLRNSQREGLIRARMYGADMTSGDVLVFLDAHIECNVEWLEPILYEIQRRRRVVIQPFIDGIDIVNMDYSGPLTIAKSAFTWDLRYVWIEIPSHVQEQIITEGNPYASATLVGCAFAVLRSYFYELGGLDIGLRIWGGENIELAFRTWMCGGVVLTSPCSRVGHMFKLIPYPDEVARENAWLRNLARVSSVWMDEYKRYFQRSIEIHEPQYINDLTVDGDQSLQQWRDLRSKLQCRNFQWYLDNVIPELPLPPRDAAFHGEITNKRTHACWEVMNDGHITINYRCYEHKIIPLNFFTLTRDGFMLYRDKCVKFLYPTPSIAVDVCPKNPKEFGIWRMDLHGDERSWGQLHVTMVIGNKEVTWCVEHLTSSVDPHRDQQMAQTAPHCDINNEFQFWAFTYRFKYD